jgi:hypothetical protein
MFLILIITIVFLIIVVIKRIKKQKILSEQILIHLGGHPKLNANSKVLLQIRSNNTVYFYNKNNTDEEIPISALTKFKVKSKHDGQILILSYLQNELEVSCLFKQSRNNQQLDHIVKILEILKLNPIVAMVKT